MRIALYHPWLKQRGGAERVILRVAQLSTHDVSIFTKYYNPRDTYDYFKNIDINVLGHAGTPDGFLERGIKYGLGSLYVDIPTDEFDILVISEAGIGCLAALANHSIPIACICHTPLRVGLSDFQSYYHKKLTIGQQIGVKVCLPVYNELESKAWSYFDSVVANSQTTKNRILEKNLANSQNITVIHPGVDLTSSPSEIFDKYILYPSRFTPYKRQKLAIEAFEKADISEFKLILAGPPQDPEYVRELNQRSSDNVEIRTEVDDSTLETLYRECYAVLYIPLREDWGLVPLEAGSYGKPVVGVNEGGIQESIMDQKTGIMTNPNQKEIATALRKLAYDETLAQELGASGWYHSRQFSMESFVDQVDDQLTTLHPMRNK